MRTAGGSLFGGWEGGIINWLDWEVSSRVGSKERGDLVLSRG